METIEPIVKDILFLLEQGQILDERVKYETEHLVNEIDAHNLEIEKLEEAIKAKVEPFKEPADVITSTIEKKKDQIADILTANDTKTVELDIAKVQMKTTKSVQVISNVDLVKALSGITDGIKKGVKAFNLPYLRKLMEVGVIKPGVAYFTEKQKVYITPAKAEAVK